MSAADPFRVIRGEMAERVRNFDWTMTPLGPIGAWLQSLKTAVSMVLLSPVPIVMLWGEDGIMIYNDAYSVFAGGRHPQLLGSKVREGWPEVADFNDNVMKVGLAGGTLAYREQELTLHRTGKPEQVWMNLDYSPILDESGKPAGVMAIVVETTERVRADTELRRSEERLRLATENAGIGLWDIDANGGIDFSYSRDRSSFVMAQDERVPMEHLLSQLHPEDALRLRDAYNAARDPAVRSMMDVEYRVLPTEEAPLRWIKVRGRGVFDAEGNCVRISGTALDITRERETQESLARSEELLRLATENAEIGMWDMDVVNNRNYSNALVKKMFGIPPEDDPPPEEFFALVHPEDSARVTQAYREAFDPQKRGTYDVQYRVVGRNDGITRWIHAKGRGLFDSNGICLRVTGTAIDITGDSEIAQSLARSEEQLRLATEYADVGLWDVDLVSDVVYWPPRVNVMFGLEPGTTVTMKEFRAFIHPEDRRRTIELILAACDPDKRSFYDAEYRIIRRNDGTVRWLSAKGRAIFDAAGRCIRMLGVIIDITARKNAEQEIRDLNETLERKVIERTQARGLTWQVTPDLMGALNSQGYFETSNPAWKTVLGWTEEEVASMSIFELLHPDDVERTREGFDLTQIGEPAIRFPNRYRCRDGSYRWISWVGVPEDGMVYCTGRDITEEKAAEEELLLAQDALRQAQKMEAIGNLTGGIAHDFNNLLQGLTGSLDLIRRKPDNTERVRQWAEAGLQAAERGAKLTAQLLAFSRAQKLELKPINLSGLLEGMRDLLGRTLGPSMRVVLDLAPGEATVMGDETQLEMSVLNLAINARDAMPEGGTLTIATTRRRIAQGSELTAGDYLELCVSDTGTGMPPDVVARAFDPFFTTKGVGKGTGLGLSQVYGMAQQAGGTARIASEPGKGTTISIFLRITSDAAMRNLKGAERNIAPAASAATVLVIDDDADVRRFLAESLDSFGYAVLEADSGAAGLEVLERLKPDVMVIDYAMPGMTGVEVARQVRIKHPTLPILFASGYAETRALETVSDENTRILRKPFRIDDLQDAVAKALRR